MKKQLIIGLLATSCFITPGLQAEEVSKETVAEKALENEISEKVQNVIATATDKKLWSTKQSA